MCALEFRASSTSCWKVNLVVQDLAHYLDLCRESIGPYGLFYHLLVIQTLVYKIIHIVMNCGESVNQYDAFGAREVDVLECVVHSRETSGEAYK